MRGKASESSQGEGLGASTPTEALASLASAVSGMRRAIRGSEPAFLETARELEALLGSARATVHAARMAADSSESEPSDALSTVLTRLEPLLAARGGSARSRLESAGQLIRGTSCLAAAGAELEDAARRLRAVASQIRVESARAVLAGSGMEAVASEVATIAGAIHARFRAVHSDAGALERAAARAAAKAEVMVSGLGVEARSAVEEARLALGALRQIAAARAEVAERAAVTSEAAASDVGAMLVALQGHDAARQAIEHVIAELTAVAGDLVGPDAVAAAGARCLVASAQVGGARGRLVGTLSEISGALLGLSGRVRDLSARAASLDNGEEGAQLQRVERAATALSSALCRYLDQDGEALGAARAASSGVATITSHLEAIRKLSAAVRILALNAEVETERTGTNGRVLQVLAREIGLLAGETRRNAALAARAVDEISGAGAGLAMGAGADSLEDPASLADEVEKLAEALRTTRASRAAALRQVRAGASALAARAAAANRRVEAGVAIAETLGGIERDLDALALALGEPGTDPTPSGALEAARTRYTMQAERDIHAQTIGTGVRSAGCQAASARAPSPFGGNVELF